MAFHGKQYKGAARIARQLKREEAEARNAVTPDDQRRAARRERNANEG
jgi:hypothetical protein